MRWIRPEKRLAIYLRDGLACSYCGTGVETSGTQLTLDHLRPRIRQGCNDATNLVTSCMTCNTSRQARSVAVFARVLADYKNNGLTAEVIVRRVRNNSRRALDVQEAKTILARRGTIESFLSSHDDH